MRQNSIVVKRNKKFKATTDSNHSFNIAPNLLNRDFLADRPNQKWADDISYLMFVAYDRDYAKACDGRPNFKLTHYQSGLPLDPHQGPNYAFSNAVICHRLAGCVGGDGSSRNNSAKEEGRYV